VVVLLFVSIVSLSTIHGPPPTLAPAPPSLPRKEVHPDGRPLRRDFPLQVEMLGGERDAAGRVQMMAGEPVAFRIKAGRDAYVGVWYVDDQGKVVQLFPNEFERDNHVRAGEVREVPPRGARYAIKATESHGPEHVHVVATTKPWEPPAAKRAGPYSLFDTAEEKEQWQTFLRGLVIVPEAAPKGEAASAAEAIVPFEARPGQ
jgi:hypothetical protein